MKAILLQDMLDLQPDKVREMRRSDVEKKWRLIAHHRSMQQTREPKHYLDQLSVAINNKKSSKKVRIFLYV